MKGLCEKGELETKQTASDFWLFPKLKEKLSGCLYETIEEMKEAMTKVIDTLTQEYFHAAFQKLLVRYKYNWPPVPLSLAALLSRSAGLLNRGSWGPKPFAGCWFSL